MRAWPLFARLSRPVLAVAVLYALVLGSFVGTLAPRQLAAGMHILCGPDDAREPGPRRHDTDQSSCCRLACPGSMTLLPPRPATASIVRDATTIGWAQPATPQPSPPPEHDARARGPPIA